MGIAVLVIVISVIGILWVTGTFPDVFAPSEKGDASGDLSFVFLDRDGDPISAIAVYAGGHEISAWRVSIELTATPARGNLESVTFSIVYTMEIEGLEEYTERWKSLTSREWTSEKTDAELPFSKSWSYEHSVQLLEAYPQYRTTGGWRITGTCEALVTGTFSDGENVVHEWSGSKWFTCYWEEGDYDLTGSIGVTKD